MGALDSYEVTMSRSDNYVNRLTFEQTSPMAVSLREKHTIDEYARCLAVYKEVMQSYVQFFIDYWVKDDVNKTNRLMTEELEKVGIVGWTGFTEEENNPLGEYVLLLDYPISWSNMKVFFERVLSGDLEFRCRYPIGNTNARDMIKCLGITFNEI